MNRGLFVDLVVVAFFAFALVRGYRNGSVRETFGLIGLISGIVVAPFVAAAVGSVIASLSGLPANMGRLIALLVLVGAVQVGFSVWGRRTARGVEISGPRSLDRAGGVVLGALRAVTVAALVLYALLGVSASYPDLPGFAQGVQGSRSGDLLADLDSPLTSFLDSMLTRTEGMRTLTLSVRQLTELRVQVPADRIAFPGTAEIVAFDRGGRELLDLMNEERVSKDLAPLEWCEPCAEVARSHAKDMYTNGYFSHVNLDGDDPFERIAAARIRYVAAGENLAIAPSISAAHEGLMASPDHRENILRPSFDEVGIGVFEGPYGLMCTQVFRGT